MAPSARGAAASSGFPGWASPPLEPPHPPGGQAVTGRPQSPRRAVRHDHARPLEGWPGTEAGQKAAKSGDTRGSPRVGSRGGGLATVGALPPDGEARPRSFPPVPPSRRVPSAPPHPPPTPQRAGPRRQHNSARVAGGGRGRTRPGLGGRSEGTEGSRRNEQKKSGGESGARLAEANQAPAPAGPPPQTPRHCTKWLSSGSDYRSGGRERAGARGRGAARAAARGPRSDDHSRARRGGAGPSAKTAAMRPRPWPAAALYPR